MTDEITVYGRLDAPDTRPEDRDPTVTACSAIGEAGGYGPDYFCTRNRGHEGAHEASGLNQKIIASWPQREQQV